MPEIRLWAPLAHRADAHVGDTVHPMTPAGDGCFTVDLPVGTRYLLSVDGGEPRPDPRSPRQPEGIHGPSEVFDAPAHAWTDAGWAYPEVLGGVFYELHVGTFTDAGTLDSAIERLPHLVELGVDTVEVMPVQPFPGERGWGYDGVSLYAIHEAYGGPAALQRFVDAAHGLGLAVCLDVVYNHFGPAGNYVSTFGPYFTEKHHTPWGAAINLDDAHADGVRAFIVDAACRWLRDFHVDALRLDAVHALVDDSQPHLLAELSDAVTALRDELGQRRTLIAESDLNQVSMITPTAEGGLGMDGQWADDVHHALHSWLTGETFGYYVDFGPISVLEKALTGVFVHDGTFSTFRDETWGAPVPDDVERRRFVTFTQNHDQVGNRGLGDRPDERLAPGAVAGGAALLLLSPFTPMLFQGQEWGTRRPFRYFTDHDPELGRLVTQGRMREFAQHGWDEIYGPGADIPDPQDPATFAASTLDWDEASDPEHAATLAWHRTLIALRRTHLHPDDRGGNLPLTVAHGADWIAMTHGPLTVVASPRSAVEIDCAAQLGCDGELTASAGDATLAGGVLTLGPASVAVLLG
ncbi:malto-oligosyltrehalose trehalohydrolase [Propioniciclava soli]|uniref:Malto-oligosyltrehalose trehalohydrolase n=1 Tax=Propioniciclava soli TaxID=2775081 RepID=A0ABZ3C6B6_9ACTN